jgi:uncharacterized membrane protein YheB (UPF0754 family)
MPMKNQDMTTFITAIAKDNLVEATEVFKKIIEAKKQKRVQGIMQKNFSKAGKSLGCLLKK